MAPGNEASLSSIRAHKEGRPDWWRVGRAFPMIFRILRADRWELTVPYFRIPVEAKNAPLLAILGNSGEFYAILENFRLF